MENTTYGMKFSDLARVELLDGSEHLIFSIWSALRHADRHYLTDNLDPSSEGNYLEDFLSIHGQDQISPIEFHRGTPHCAGIGIIFTEPNQSPLNRA